MKAKPFFPLETHALSLSFLKNKMKKKALDGINITLSERGITAIVGENGSGKTLLLKCLANLTPPTSGTIRWRQKPKPPQLTFVPQQPVLLDCSVADNIRAPLKHNRIPDITKRCDEALSWANIHELSNQPALTLSTGEQQLVALARAWALSPSILLLDEPIANLDPARCLQINRLIQKLSLSCKIILTTHSIQQAKHLADDIIVLNNGQLLEHLDSHTFFNSNYAQHFEGSL